MATILGAATGAPPNGGRSARLRVPLRHAERALRLGGLGGAVLERLAVGEVGVVLIVLVRALDEGDAAHAACGAVRLLRTPRRSPLGSSRASGARSSEISYSCSSVPSDSSGSSSPSSSGPAPVESETEL